MHSLLSVVLSLYFSDEIELCGFFVNEQHRGGCPVPTLRSVFKLRTNLWFTHRDYTPPLLSRCSGNTVCWKQGKGLGHWVFFLALILGSRQLLLPRLWARTEVVTDLYPNEDVTIRCWKPLSRMTHFFPLKPWKTPNPSSPQLIQETNRIYQISAILSGSSTLSFHSTLTQQFMKPVNFFCKI